MYFDRQRALYSCGDENTRERGDMHYHPLIDEIGRQRELELRRQMTRYQLQARPAREQTASTRRTAGFVGRLRLKLA
jgi:hypothetical protein